LVRTQMKSAWVRTAWLNLSRAEEATTSTAGDASLRAMPSPMSNCGEVCVIQQAPKETKQDGIDALAGSPGERRPGAMST